MTARIKLFAISLIAIGPLAACSAPTRVDPDLPFLSDVRPMLSADGLGNFSDDDLIQLARDTCTQLGAGVTVDQIMALVRIADAAALAAEIGALTGAAKVYYCPAQK